MSFRSPSSLLPRILPNAVMAWWHEVSHSEPWSASYQAFRTRELARLLGRGPTRVPTRPFGAWIDERIVEYPWVLERLESMPPGSRLLDAGAGLNSPIPLRRLLSRGLRIRCVTLERERFADPCVDYSEADLRRLPFDDESFEATCCLSTLEHVGMDNARYARGAAAARSDPGEWRAAVGELWRVTARGGRLLITAPCGRAVDHGWFQVLAPDLDDQVRGLLPHAEVRAAWYRHRADGWHAVRRDDVAACECWDPASTGTMSSPRRAAFSEAIVCIDIRRPVVDRTA